MNFLKLAVIFPLLLVSSAFAQSSTSIGAASGYVCIFLANGKTNVARVTSKGNRVTSFANAKDDFKQRRASALSQIKALNKIITNLNRILNSSQLWDGFTAKELRTLKRYLKSGELQDHPGQIVSTVDNLKAIVARLQGDAQAAQNYLNLLEDCKKRKMPGEGEFPVVFKALIVYPDDVARQEFGTGIVAVFAKIPWAYALSNQPSFCFQKPRGSRFAIDESVNANPCYLETLSNYPGACDGLVEYGSKGEVVTGVALLAHRQFSYINRPGSTFEANAARVEAALRSDATGGWTDSVRFLVREGRTADECSGPIF